MSELTDFQIVGSTSSRDELRTIIAMEQVTILLIDLDQDEALDTIIEALEIKSDIAVVGVTGSQDVQKIIMSQRAGCRQLAGKPLNAEDLRVAIKRAINHSEDLKMLGKSICVVGSGGGVGSTTFACYLTMAIAELTKSPTAIIDFDLEFGTVARSWDFQPKCTIADVVQSGSIDRLLLEDAIVDLPSGVAVLARPMQIEQAHLLNEGHATKIIEATRSMYPYLVMDLPRKLDEICGAAIQASKKLIVVVEMTANAVYNAGRLSDSLMKFGLPADSIDFVVNRYCKGVHSLSIEALEERVGKKTIGVIPNNYKALLAAGDIGEPVSDKSPVRKSVLEIAAKICGVEAPKIRKSWMPNLSFTK
ncbi:MAG: AAA family ATPase [Planctomycetia bacterium]|nr:AAA family ATPase [Planctomycetia bacterium]MCC7316357.1 AAA family ATPase [Planctomycetota bacterium]